MTTPITPGVFSKDTPQAQRAIDAQLERAARMMMHRIADIELARQQLARGQTLDAVRTLDTLLSLHHCEGVSLANIAGRICPDTEGV